MPQDWIDVVESSRQNPSPFKVIDVDQGVIRNWTEFLEDQFVKKCPFQTRPIKEVRVEATSQNKIFHRNSYNGAWLSNEIKMANRPIWSDVLLEDGQFIQPPRAYSGKMIVIITSTRNARIEPTGQLSDQIV